MNFNETLLFCVSDCGMHNLWQLWALVSYIVVYRSPASVARPRRESWIVVETSEISLVSAVSERATSADCVDGVKWLQPLKLNAIENKCANCVSTKQIACHGRWSRQASDSQICVEFHDARKPPIKPPIVVTLQTISISERNLVSKIEENVKNS